MQIVSFDFGTKKQVLLLDKQKQKRHPHQKLIFNKNNAVNWVKISSIINEWKPDLLLVGKPLNMDGTDSDIMEKVDTFLRNQER